MARRARKKIDTVRDMRRAQIDQNYRERHPQRVREERAFRVERIAREKAYARRDKMFDGGTPETSAKAARVRQGSLARLYESGAISIDQLAASQQIRAIAERIGRDVAIGTVSLETRVDQSHHGDGAFYERLGAVRAEVAYGRWRAELAQTKSGAAPVLAMVVEDLSVTACAARYRMRKEGAKALLIAALDLWCDMLGDVCEEIDEASVLAAQAGIL